MKQFHGEQAVRACAADSEYSIQAHVLTNAA